MTTEVKRDLTAEQRRRKPTLPGTDDAWPIGDEEDLRAAIQSFGRAKDEDRAKVKRWIIRRARELGKIDLLPDSWNVTKDARGDELETKAGGADRNRGGAENLRNWYVHGGGAAEIGWGTPGDFMRCVAIAGKHMTSERAKGYCNLRHQEAVGSPPGKGHKALLGGGDAREDTTAPAGNTGVMVALYPPYEVAMQLAALAGEDGTSATEMHVTLAFLGDMDEVEDPDALVEIVRAFAAESPELTGMFSGIGRFTMPPGAEDTADAWYASVDVPELSAFREDLLDELDDNGIAWRTDHGFTPHATLAYLDPDEPTPAERMDPVLEVTFDMLSVAIGDDVWDFPLDGVADDAVEDDVVDEGTSMAEEALRARDGAEVTLDDEADVDEEVPA